MNTSKIKASRIVSLILLLLGLLVSSYLLYRYIKISGAANEGIVDVCSAIFDTGCDTALQSAFSSVLGLPLSGWGIIYYCSIFLLLVIPALYGKSFKQAADLMLYLMTLAGIITAIVLITVMFVIPSLFCPLCTIIHIINMVLFFLLNYTNGFSAQQVWPSIKEGIDSLFSRKIKLPETRWKIFGLLSAAFLVMSMYFGLKILAKSPDNQQASMIDPKPILDEFYSQPVREILVTDEDHIIGDINSPIRMVVFSDFFCPSCKVFAKDLPYIFEEEGGKFNVVFKHFPLSTTCNPSITKNMHPGACDAALAAIAAQQQGKFWAYHDTLFRGKQGTKMEYFHSLAKELGLDVEFFERDMNSEKAKSKLSRDIALAEQLGIDATPTIYLNGRLITDLRRGIPQFLLGREIKDQAVKDSINRSLKDTLK